MDFKHRLSSKSGFAGFALLAVVLVSCNKSSTGGFIVKKLDAPELQSVEADDGFVTVTWTPVDKAESYNLYWHPRPGVAVEKANLFQGLKGTTYVHTGVAAANTYHYRVAAVRRNKVGHLSQERKCTLAPAAVEVISISAGDGEVTVSWEEVDGALSHNLYRSTVPDVTPKTGVLLANVTSPFVDTDVINDTTYYYVVTAVGEGGESKVSPEVSACPKWVVDAPTNVTVTVMEDLPNALVISWDPPAGTPPDSYNLYWDITPGVTVGTNAIADVESPYSHTGLAGKVTHYYILTANKGMTESEASVEVSGTPRGSPGGGEGDLGNNLALPVNFSDGHGLFGALVDITNPDLDLGTGLRPTDTDVTDPFPYYDPDSVFLLNGVEYYQQHSLSTWRAGWMDGSAGPQEVVADWGDNLAAQSFKVGSVVRVETILYQDTTATDPTDTLLAYNMTHLFGSGANEMWGTDTTTYDSNLRHVFAVNARLTIEKLDGPGGNVDPTVPGFDSAVYEGFAAEGPVNYAAEINVSGKLVFGYVWMLKQWPITDTQKRGWWRITFSLDPTAEFGDVKLDNNTFLQALDESDPTAQLDAMENKTWMEIQVN